MNDSGNSPISKVSKVGPRLRTAVPILVLGIVLAISGVVRLGMEFWDVVSGPSYTIPGTIRLQLDDGTYTVFERIGYRDTSGPVTVSRFNSVTLNPSNVEVTGPDGETVRVRRTGSNQSIDQNSAHFVSAVEFEPPRSGRYTLRFDSPDRGQVLVQHSFEEVFLRNVPWFLAVVLGGVLGVLGLVLLTVGIVRRSRAKRPALAPIPISAVAPQSGRRPRGRESYP